MEEARFAEAFAERGKVYGAEALVGSEREFERGAFQVIDENF